jgi:hypothetical protein
MMIGDCSQDDRAGVLTEQVSSTRLLQESLALIASALGRALFPQSGKQDPGSRLLANG